MRTPEEAKAAPKQAFQKKQGGFQEDESNWEAERDELLVRIDKFVEDHYKGQPITMGSKACRKAVKATKAKLELAGWKVKYGWDPQEQEKTIQIWAAY